MTPAHTISNWTANTLEQDRIVTRLIELGVTLRTGRKLVPANAELRSARVFTGPEDRIDCDAIVLATSRTSDRALYDGLVERWSGDSQMTSLRLIEDAEAPGTVAAAVYVGHRAAREYGGRLPSGVPFKRQIIGEV